MNRSHQNLSTAWESLEKADRPVEVSWTTELGSSREALWPLLTDTSSVNERLGLPKMEFEERNGQLFGTSGSGWTRQKWAEVPWTWEAGKWLTAERRYSRGFARAVRVRYLLDEHHGATKLTINASWIPRSWWTRPILRYINRWLRTQYDRVLRDLDEIAGNQHGKHTFAHSNADIIVNEGRLQVGVSDLTENGFSQIETERLANFIRTASDQILFRIRPKRLAFEWGIELEDLLALLLQAIRSGLLRLSWDVMCPHCLGVRKESRSLGDLREFGRCDICDIDFNATKLESIEVTFRVLPEIREVREVYYCAAEPAKKPHILVQHQLRPNETYKTELALPPGRYRLRRAVGDKASISFEVNEAKGADTLTWNANDQASEPPVLLRSNVNLVLVNPEVDRVSIVLEKVAADPTALRPSELFNLQRFRDLFSEESIATGLKLELGHQTLLFTDIVGSTRLYAELGDSKAFNAVHTHFVALQEIIGSRRGAVVKTIGDAMMAGFQNPEDALEAAVEIQKRFRSGGQHQVALRVSIHRGICLAVRLESNIDYFGNAVNYAAKMQSVAGAGEIVISREFYSLPGMPDRTRSLRLNVVESAFSLLSDKAGASNTVWLASIGP